MEKNLKNKKGELTTQQIVLLIILLVSFVIILFLLFRLNFGKETEKELCHNSVMMRGSAAVPTEAAPLKCSTTYLCITKDGSCEGLTKPEIEKVKTKDEIYQVLADEMADCWWMFGEGKVNYVEKTVKKNNYCSICSQILFDDSLEDVEGIDETISKDELYEYLFENKYSGEETYAQYLFGTNNLNYLKQQISNSGDNTESIGTFGEIDIGKNQYYVVMGITSGVSSFKWAAIGGVGAAVVSGIVCALTGPPGWVAGAIILAGAGAGAAGGATGGAGIAKQVEPEIGAITVKGDGVANQFMAPTIQEAESEKFKAINCEEIINKLS